MFILSHKKYGEFEDFDVSSESSPNTSYLVTIDHDEETCYCTCPDFRYRKDNQTTRSSEVQNLMM